MIRKLIRTCLILSAASLFICGISLIVISFLSFNEVKALLDSIAPDGNVQSFSVKHIILLLTTGILLCVVGGTVYLFRERVLQCVYEFKVSSFLISPKNIAGLISDFIRDLKDALKKEDKIHLYTFMFLVILAAAARIFFLFQPMISDETRVFEDHIYHSYGLTGFFQLISRYYEVGDHMFYTLLSYLSYKLIGSELSTWTTRLPALFAGILIVPATYMVVRIFYNKYSALLAAGIITASSHLIYYSTKARGYSIMCLIFLLILALGAHLKKENNLAGWHLFAILSAVGFYTIPLMLWPYGIVITWLTLSIIFKDTNLNRSNLLNNLFVSIIMTVFLTILLYSPIIFFGTGVDSLFAPDRIQSLPLGVFADNFSHNYVTTWTNFWHKSVPDTITWLLATGFFISLIFHKKLSTNRINIVLAGGIWLTIIFIVQRLIAEPRHLIFLLPLYIGLASSGLTYLFRQIEPVFGRYKPYIFSILVIILSVVLLGNKVLSEPYRYVDSYDDAGNFIDISYIGDSIGLHIRKNDFHIERRRVLLDENSNKSRILTVFASPLKNDDWMKILKISYKMAGRFLISDPNLYLSNEARRCHNLFLLSDESLPVLESLLVKKGLSVSDYSYPQLVHRYKYATLYKMERIKDCKVQ